MDHSPRRPLLAIVGAAAILLGLPGPLRAGVNLLRETYEGLDGTRVEVDAVFSPAARSGSLPFLVTIVNGSDRDRTWTLRFREGNHGRALTTESVHRFLVPSGAEARHEIAFAFAPEFAAYSYRNLEIEITSPGLRPINRSHGLQTPSTLPSIAMSQALASRNLSRLNEAAKSRNSSDPVFASSFSPGELPTQWVALTGIDQLLIDLDEWESLAEAQRRALLEWVRLGGGLNFYAARERLRGERQSERRRDAETEASNEPPPSRAVRHLPGLPDLVAPADPSEPAVHPYSLGRISLRPWDGRELPDSTLQDYSGAAARSTELASHYTGSWKLPERLGRASLNTKLIFLLLFAFAIVVAPVNLFFIAGKGRRHRLFVTTPLISLGACVLVVATIFLSDGLGGRGYRAIFADLQPAPGEMRLYLLQEQMSRTGVMARSGFEADRALALDPVKLRRSSFNALDSGGTRGASYRLADRSYHGDLFPSRSEQGFVVRASEPTRSRLEVGAGGDGSPLADSSLPVALEALYYRDADGGLWRLPPGAALSPGGKAPLAPAEEQDFQEWIKERLVPFSKGQRDRIKRLADGRDRYFATVSDPAPFALATHPKIRWEESHVLLSGTPPAPWSGAAPPATEPRDE